MEKNAIIEIKHVIEKNGFTYFISSNSQIDYLLL